MLVAGVDGYKGGWIAITLRDDGFLAAGVWPKLADLANDLSDAVVMAIDIPIGLPASGPRGADLAARTFVGPRRSSVFPAPPRTVLEAASYEEAVQVSRDLWGTGISRQSWALRDKILEADAVACADPRLHESHPEATFRAMAGKPLLYPKLTWNGQMLRRSLLERNGIVLPTDMGDAANVPVDDLLDAAACAWTATRIAAGTAGFLPEDSPADAPRIWF